MRCRARLIWPLVAVAFVASACQSSAPSAPNAAPSFAGTAAAPASGWPTYQRDLSRSGADPALPAVTSLRRDWTVALDGPVYAQSLISGNRVFAATEHDSVYALSASSGQVVWRRNLGTPMPGSALPCGDIDPSGITGTPVIDQSLGRLYVVAFVEPGRHVLAAIDLNDGSVVFQRPIDPVGANPLIEQQRAALALSRGTVYIAFGGLFGDCGNYHGWIVGASQTGGGSLLTYQVPSRGEAGIWAPAGPSVDADGDLYVATGNSQSSLFGASFDFGNAVIRLSDTLHVLDWWAPSNWSSLNNSDTDLGSVGAALLPGSRLFQIGKEGVGYLLHPDHLGGINGSHYAKQVCGAAFGATAFAASYLYVPCTDGLVALRIGGFTFSIAWRSSLIDAGPPIAAGGLVWTIDIAGGELYGFDPRSGAIREHAALPAVEHFAAPSAGDQRLFIPTSTGLQAFATS